MEIRFIISAEEIIEKAARVIAAADRQDGVSKCCEKWRSIAADRCEYAVGPCVRITTPRLKHCPECGGRL